MNKKFNKSDGNGHHEKSNEKNLHKEASLFE